jgi:hypothetical protein
VGTTGSRDSFPAFVWIVARRGGQSWLVEEDRFSVTDIFVGYVVVWAHAQGKTVDLPNVAALGTCLLEAPAEANAQT